MGFYETNVAFRQDRAKEEAGRRRFIQAGRSEAYIGVDGARFSRTWQGTLSTTFFSFL